MKTMEELLNFSLINIDKPAGPTSYSISEFVKRQLKLKKTSHMGTLDPKVTGVLPITLGRACKLAGYFIRHDKEYIGILETHKNQKIKELQKIINKHFVGRIKQTPPNRSAVKREERERTVYGWKLLEGKNNREFLFICKVEGGTYIRKMCSDLGEIIGGAHMGELRRTSAGIFNESKLYNLYDFKSALDKWKNGDEEELREMLVPAEDAIKKVLPTIKVDKSAVKSLYIGKPLFISNIIGSPKIENGEVFALFCEKIFIGIYRKISNKVIFAKPEFVFN